jgi:FG-GAP-like repeat
MTGTGSTGDGSLSSRGSDSSRTRAPRRASTLIAALLACFALSFAIAPTASALPENFFGFQFGNGYPESEPDMEAVARSGADYWRIGFDCSNKNWTLYDKEVRLAWEHGISIIANPSNRCGGPANEGARVPVASEWEPQGSVWETWLYELVGHYGWNGSFWSGKSNIKPITVWEIWNEPNRGINSQGGLSAGGAYYGSFLKRSATALREAQDKQATCCGIKVLMGGLLTLKTGIDGEGYENKSVHDFLEEASGISGLGSKIDGVSLHPYSFGSEALKNVKNNITTARENINSTSGFGSTKGLWITEVGWPVENGDTAHPNVSLQEQKELLKGLFDWVKEQQVSKNIQSILYYNYRDFNFDKNPWWTRSGVRSMAPPDRYSQETFRPSWYGFQEETGAPKWPVKPGAQTTEATGIKIHQATLWGTVNPHGLQTGYHFEYGPAENFYTNWLPSQYIDSGWKEGTVSHNQTLFGLQPNTVYHYRIVAINENEEIEAGGDKWFKTAPVGTHFAPPTSWGTWPSGYALDLADVSGDGRADAVGENSSNDIQVGFASGEGKFLPSSSWSSEYSLDFADVSGDGRVDELGKNASGDIQVAWASAAGGFLPASSWGTWPSGYSLDFADVSGDGRADALGKNSAGDIKVAWASGEGKFLPATSWGTWPSGYSLEFADVSGDGRVDALGKNSAGDIKVAWSAPSEGKFLPATSWGTWPSGYSIDFADVSNDGRADALGKNSAGDIKVAWASAEGKFFPASSWGTWPSGYSIDFADISGDGRADALGMNSAGDVKVAWASAENKFLQATTWTTWPSGYSIDFADVSTDHRVDALGRDASGEVKVAWSAPSEGKFLQATTWGWWSSVYTRDFVNVGGDARADSVGRTSTGNIQVAWSAGNKFLPPSSWGTWSAAYSLEFADVGGDGLADAVGKNSSGDIQVGFSSGAKFLGSTSWGAWPSGYSLEFADVTGDARADAVGKNSSGDLKVGFSSGTSFLGSTSWVTWPSGYSLDFADVTGDALADAVGKNSAGDIKVGVSTGAKFLTPISWGTWPSGYSIDFADVNNDTRADAVGKNAAGDVQVAWSWP